MQQDEALIQELGLQILRQLHREDARLSSVIAHVFRERRALPAGVKGAVVDRVHAVVRSQRWLDHLIASLAEAPVTGGLRDLARWLVRSHLDGAITLEAARRQWPRYAWDRLAEAAHAVDASTDPAARLALRHSLPDWLAARWIDALGPDEAEALATGLDAQAPQTIRANTVRTDREALAEALRARGLVVTPTSRAAHGLIMESRTDLFRLPEFKEGLFEVQDEGSQLVSELVAPPPGGSILDACAGTGGKTLHLGALLGGKGTIVAIGVGEPGRGQLAELRRRARRAGLHNIRFVEMPDVVTAAESSWTADSHADADAAAAVPDAGAELDASASPPDASAAHDLLPQAERFDRVLVDAPCSGLGVLRRNPEVRRHVTPESIARLAALQQAILERFAVFVRPGGRLIYATCSVLRQENEAIVDAFLQAHADFTPTPAKEILGGARAAAIGDGMVLRLLPHRHGTDGFFAAVLRRSPQKACAG